MFFLLFNACSDMYVNIWGEMNEGTIDITWESISLRSENQPWDSTWFELNEFSNLTLEESPQIIASGKVDTDRYIQIFTDAQQILSGTSMLDDIIEPIACPFGPYGNHDLKVTYIVIDQAVFAMHCERY